MFMYTQNNVIHTLLCKNKRTNSVYVCVYIYIYILVLFMNAI